MGIVPVPLPAPPEVARVQGTGRSFTGKILLHVSPHPSGTTTAYTAAITLPAHVPHTRIVSSAMGVSASTGYASANVYFPLTGTKWPKLYMDNDNPGARTDAYIANNFDLVLLRRSVQSQAVNIKNLNSKILLFVYATPQLLFIPDNGNYPWSSAFLAAPGFTEDWLLHNPDGNLTSATRVRRPGDSTPDQTNFTNPRNSACNTWLANEMVSMLQGTTIGGTTLPTAYDGIFDDGAWGFSSIDHRLGSYTLAPTLAEEQGWGGAASGGTDPAWIIAQTDAINNALRTAGFKGNLCNTTFSGFAHATPTPGTVDDRFMKTHCYGQVNEFFLTDYSTSGSPFFDLAEWPYVTQRLFENCTADKPYVVYCGTATTAALYFTLASFLLYTDGVNGYWYPGGGSPDFQSSTTFALTLQALIASGPDSTVHNGAAFVNANGNYERQFKRTGGGGNVRIIVNPSGGTLGGIPSGRASIDGTVGL